MCCGCLGGCSQGTDVLCLFCLVATVMCVLSWFGVINLFVAGDDAFSSCSVINDDGIDPGNVCFVSAGLGVLSFLLYIGALVSSYQMCRLSGSKTMLAELEREAQGPVITTVDAVVDEGSEAAFPIAVQEAQTQTQLV